MKIKVCDANTDQLNWLVAKCEGLFISNSRKYGGDLILVNSNNKQDCMWFKDYTPTTNWVQGGPIIEREGLNASVHVVHNGVITSWVCEKDWPNTKSQSATGATLLVAAMRCFIILKLGDIVDISKFTSLNSPL